MDHIWENGAVSIAPTPPTTPSTGYPIEGLQPTTPGAYWFHMITEEIRNAIMAGGITPKSSDTNQLAQAIAAIAAANNTGGTGGGQGAYTVLTNPFTMPAINASTTAIVQSTTWTAPGAWVYIPGAGTLQVQGITGNNSMSLTNTGIANNSGAGTIIPTQTQVVATGQVGPQGVAGSGAYTFVTAAYTQPTAGGTVTVAVGSTSWMIVNQAVFITLGGYYTCSQILDGTHVLLTNLGTTGNASAGSNIPANAGLGSAGAVGPQGNPGNPGPAAYTTVTQGFSTPNVGSNTSVSVGSALWMVPGMTVYVQGAGYYQVSSVTNSQTAVLINLGYAGNANPGVVVSSGLGITAAGVPGAAGAQGISAYTTLNGGYTQPAIGANVTVSVANTAFTSIGQYIYVQNGGCYQVQGITSGFVMTLTNITAVGNVAPGTTIPSGGVVSVSGPPGANGNGTGTVTSVNVINVNGLTGTVDNSATNPALKLGTTVTGMVKAGGGAFSAAVAGTDYAGLASVNSFSQPQTFAAGTNFAGSASPLLMTGIPGTAGQALISQGAGVTPVWTTLNYGTVNTVSVAQANGFNGTVANAGTSPAITIIATPVGLLKSNGTAISAAQGGVDYALPSTNNNWTALQSYTAGLNLSGTTAPFQVNGSTGTPGQYLMSQGTGNSPAWVTLSQNPGTVTGVSVANANGFNGTVANAGSSPAITIIASPSGMIKSNGSAISSAVAGTDYIAPNVAASMTALLAIVGTTANPGIVLTNGIEQANITGTPPATTQALYASAGQIVYYNQATANWVFNITWSSTTSLNSALAAIGSTVTITAWMPQGATAYYMTGLQIDGSAVTPQWVGSAGAPTGGHASSTDMYSFAIMKIGSGSYKVIASMNQAQ